jgi:hypothetical protein
VQRVLDLKAREQRFAVATLALNSRASSKLVSTSTTLTRQSRPAFLLTCAVCTTYTSLELHPFSTTSDRILNSTTCSAFNCVCQHSEEESGSRRNKLSQRSTSGCDESLRRLDSLGFEARHRPYRECYMIHTRLRTKGFQRSMLQRQIRGHSTLCQLF